MPPAAYELRMPESWTAGALFASPHSGSAYPEALLRDSVLDDRMIRSSEDAFVDELFARAPDYGMPLLLANYPRAYVDLNRSPDELDPALIRGVSRTGSNPRVSSGLGVIPRVVASGRPIYRGKIGLEEANGRLAEVWYPYHERLQSLLAECRESFGKAILIDCHSMPHEALDNIAHQGRCPDIVLGDRFGAAADAEVMDLIEAAFAKSGLKVARNAPFAGAYTAQVYGRPSRHQHAIQIEIDRSLYMDERRITKRASFRAVQNAVTEVIAALADYCSGQTAMAAE